MNIMINAITRMDTHGDIGNWKRRKIFHGKLVFEFLKLLDLYWRVEIPSNLFSLVKKYWYINKFLNINFKLEH